MVTNHTRIGSSGFRCSVYAGSSHPRAEAVQPCYRGVGRATPDSGRDDITLEPDLPTVWPPRSVARSRLGNLSSGTGWTAQSRLLRPDPPSSPTTSLHHHSGSHAVV